jgi:hypothetical protein
MPIGKITYPSRHGVTTAFHQRLSGRGGDFNDRERSIRSLEASSALKEG